MNDRHRAIATAQRRGKGAIGVVRVSARARSGRARLDTIVRAVLDRSLTPPRSPTARAYGPFLADDGSPID